MPAEKKPAKKKPAAREEDLQQQNEVLRRQNEELQVHLAEAEETLRAIREGEVDAVIVSGAQGERVFSLVGTDLIYRLIVETMREAAFTVSFDGHILFCNQQFSWFVRTPQEQIVGRRLHEFVPSEQQRDVAVLLVKGQTETVRQRLVFKGADGTIIPAHVSATTLHQPEGPSICVVASDLTELENSTELIQQLRRQQEAIQAANEELAATEEELRVQNEELATSRAELDRTRARYEDLFESAPDGYIVTDPEGAIQEVNQAAADLLGCPAAQLKGNPFSSLLPETERESYLQLLAALECGTRPLPMWEAEIRPVKGQPFWASVAASAACDEDDRIVGLRWLIHNISKRKAAEEAVRRHGETMAGIAEVLEAVLTCPTEKDLGTKCIEIAEKLTQSKFGFIGNINEKGLEDIAISNPGWDACNILDAGGHRIAGGNFKIHGIYGKVLSSGKAVLANNPAAHPDRIGLPAGHPPLESFLGVPLIREGRTIGMIAVANRPGGYTAAEQETLEALAPAMVEAFIRKRAEEELTAAHRQLQSVIDNTPALVYACDLEARFVMANTALAALFKTTPTQILGKRRHEFMPQEDADKHETNDRDVIAAGRAVEFEEHSELPGRSITWLSTKFPLRDAQGRIYAVAGIVTDISARKQAEVALEQTAAELKRSNDDLAQFAHVASHDLQEPLRMISGFLRLLDERYKPQLDEKAREYINFSVEGANRMSQLISDLLNYGRVASLEKKTQMMDANKALLVAMASLRASIDESKAAITHDELPTVRCDGSQLTQLLQNIIGNAIKFRKPGEPCQVHIGAEKKDHEWIFSVRDKGIGIDPAQRDRVFVIFQRLHTRDKYPGTGIGLAICKKIVERHGGRIWVESMVGEGSTFFFSLPADGK